MNQVNLYVLEDDAGDFERLLEELVFRLVPERCSLIRIAWVREHSPRPRNPNYYIAFSAPLVVPEQLYQWVICTRTGGGWDRKTETPTEPLRVVPWPPGARQAAFLPHFVILDVYAGGNSTDTAAATTAMRATVAYLMGCGYPSDLVWIVSRGIGMNDRYGYFLPKPWAVSSPAYHEAVLDMCRDLLHRHLSELERRRTLDEKPQRLYQSYLSSRVGDFYETVIEPRSWRRRIVIDKGLLDYDPQFPAELWSDMAPVAAGEYCGSRILWQLASVSVASTPAGRVFSFFDGEIGGELQCGYVVRSWYGLSLDYLVKREQSFSLTLYVQPEEALRRAALEFKSNTTNVVLRRNLFIFLRTLIGDEINFNGLSLALPGVELSAASINKLTHAVFEGLTPNEWHRKRFMEPVPSKVIRT